LLYRLNGDLNPLHVDPGFARAVGFERGPILHGLATYGYCARALIQSELAGDASRLTAFHAQFRQPVWPGESLTTVGYRTEGGYLLRASAGGRDEVAVLCGAELSASTD
jgi:acyl dehydratase